MLLCISLSWMSFTFFFMFNVICTYVSIYICFSWRAFCYQWRGILHILTILAFVLWLKNVFTRLLCVFLIFKVFFPIHNFFYFCIVNVTNCLWHQVLCPTWKDFSPIGDYLIFLTHISFTSLDSENIWFI